MHRGALRLMTCLTTAVLAACSSTGQLSNTATTQPSMGGQSGPRADDSALPAQAADGGGQESGGAKVSAGSPMKGPPPLATPLPPGKKNVVPVAARLEPPCVRRGDSAEIFVQTRPQAAVQWQAVYSNGKGGAIPPFGAGYGGNEAGMADAQGNYRFSWTVKPTVPVGPGRIDVIVGHNQQWGYAAIPFAVADASGSCEGG